MSPHQFAVVRWEFHLTDAERLADPEHFVARWQEWMADIAKRLGYDQVAVASSSSAAVEWVSQGLGTLPPPEPPVHTRPDA